MMFGDVPRTIIGLQSELEREGRRFIFDDRRFQRQVHRRDMQTHAATAHRRDEVAVFSLEGGALLYDDASNKVFQLTETALAVWNDCDGGTTLHEIGERQAERYEVEPDTARADAAELLAYFADAGLLSEVNFDGCADSE